MTLIMRYAARLFFSTSLLAIAFFLRGAVPKEGPKPMREVVDKGYRVELDLTGQVLAIAIPEERHFGTQSGREEAPISPTLPGLGAQSFVSASMLSMKAKQFDDGLYAAVDLAAQQGAGLLAGKTFLLRSLAQDLAGHGASQPVAVLFGACRLGQIPVRVPDSIKGSVESSVSEFLADSVRSKPIGFYTWSKELSA